MCLPGLKNLSRDSVETGCTEHYAIVSCGVDLDALHFLPKRTLAGLILIQRKDYLGYAWRNIWNHSNELNLVGHDRRALGKQTYRDENDSPERHEKAKKRDTHIYRNEQTKRHRNPPIQQIIERA